MFDYSSQSHTFVHRFCEQYVLYSSSGLTHLCMGGYNGGRISIPEDKNDEFIEAYASDVSAGNKIYISELGSCVFNMFIDFDKMFDVLAQVDIRAIAGEWADVIVRRLRDVFEGVKFETFVSIADMKITTKGKAEYKKYGVHVNFNGLLVTAKQAVDIRRTLLNTLQREFPVESDAADTHQWTSIFDEAVYVKNPGLRMIGSRKASPHSVCSKKKAKLTRCVCVPDCCKRKKWSDKCESCKAYPKCKTCSDVLAEIRKCELCGGGKIDEGRPYSPVIYYNADGVRNDEHINELNPVDVVRKTSIRTFETMHYMLFSGNMLYNYTEEDSVVGGAKRKRDTGKFTRMPTSTEETSCSCSNSAECDFCLERGNTELQVFIEKTVSAKLDIKGDFVIDNVMYVDSGKGPRVFTASSNCTYCVQKGDYHSRNRTYFSVTATAGVRQRCYSESCTGSSSGVKLPSELKKILWPLKFRKVPKYKRLDARNTPDRMFENLMDYINKILI